jgi:hypothetical protein
MSTGAGPGLVMRQTIRSSTSRLRRRFVGDWPTQPEGSPDKWLNDKGAPWKKLENEKPRGETSPIRPC